MPKMCGVSISSYVCKFKLGVAWCIWGPKVKTDYLLLDAKLLLINMNCIDFFFKKILKSINTQKKNDKNFHTCWYNRLIVVNKKSYVSGELR